MAKDCQEEEKKFIKTRHGLASLRTRKLRTWGITELASQFLAKPAREFSREATLPHSSRGPRNNLNTYLFQLLHKVYFFQRLFGDAT